MPPLGMAIDAYDVLDVRPDCDQEEIKKAFKKMSLKEHPDKAAANGRDPEEQNKRFIRIKEAHEILEEEDRRKRYDTFGQDLGKEPPEMEVWNIGLTTLLTPLGGFLLKTTLCRFFLWLLAWRWIGNLILLLGVVCIILYALNVKIPGLEQTLREPETIAIVVNAVIICVVVIFGWIWPLLCDTIGVLYLVSEVGVIALDSWKIGGIALAISLFLAWLLQGWWWWILGLEVLLAVVLLAGVTIAAGIIRLWIDTVQSTKSENVKEWRMSMRAERKKLEDEVERLKKKIERERT